MTPVHPCHHAFSYPILSSRRENEAILAAARLPAEHHPVLIHLDALDLRQEALTEQRDAEPFGHDDRRNFLRLELAELHVLQRYRHAVDRAAGALGDRPDVAVGPRK